MTYVLNFRKPDVGRKMSRNGGIEPRSALGAPGADRVRLIEVERAEFDEGRAECMICGAFVRAAGSMTQMLVRRRFGPDAVAGQCSVCELVTFFLLRDGDESRLISP